jgi:hypothetical protein
MFLRWKHRRVRQGHEIAHYAVLVRGVWSGGTVRQRVVRYLGAIRERARTDPAQCARFWAGVTPRLDALGLDPTTCQVVEAQLTRVVPRYPALPERIPCAHDAPAPPRVRMGTRPTPPAAPLPGGLYVRWKRRRLKRRVETAWDAVLVRSIWRQGAPRQQVVGYLASIRASARTFPAHRAWFWARVDPRLDALGLDPTTRQAVEARLMQEVPRPTATELQAVAAQRAAFAQLAAESES